MNTILLQPTDVLFFRDGRPMEGSLAGHGAAWPLPNVVNAALHAALHRGFPVGKGELNGSHTRHGDHVHRVVRDGRPIDAERHRRFGSLQTAGPFPVRVDAQDCPEKWLLPRPADLQDASLTPALLPASGSWPEFGSLPPPLLYAVANRLPPAKESGVKSWLGRAAFQAYLKEETIPMEDEAWSDTDLFDAEAYLGIGIDPERQTQDGQHIYSAQYLRLKDTAGWRLGSLAHCAKSADDSLLRQLLGEQPRIVVGGQQRVCTARRVDGEPRQALPLGLKKFNTCPRTGKILVKWVLLSAAIWPEIPDRKRDGSPQHAHPGGWLPNWVFVNWDSETGEVRPDKRNSQVLLTTGPGFRKAQRKNSPCGGAMAARLVAAIVPKPIVVTGWNLGDPLSDEESERQAGACSTHLAVPAGAVYYFEAETSEAATALAQALNWHGASDGSEIRNRRSTLMGEKGFGLGVCANWKPFGDVR